MIVCDTNVLSEPMRGPKANASVVAWLDRQPTAGLYITTVVLAELLAGLKVAPAGKRVASLRDELRHLLNGMFRGRVLEFDQPAAEAFAEIFAAAKQAGRPMSFADTAIAAVARCNGFAVATRNTEDFVPAGVPLIDPWRD